MYLARSTGLGGFERQVVVKTLDLSITEDGEQFVTMFLDEARLVGALHHQYIAPVYEVGCDEAGRYYLVMDYVHGETAEGVFRAVTERGVRLPLGFSLTVASCVASALDYAHTLCAADGSPLDIVHRDVSLSNVMCGYDGAVKLIDFGIAKAANRATRTQTGTLKGKLGYLAPEQIHRRAIDHRADVFALGIVLYELTTGARAFIGPSDLATLERISRGDVLRPSEIVPDYLPELERIVLRALEIDPARRFQDAREMGREIEALAAQQGIALGHVPISRVMRRLFAEKRPRRRLARGSNEVKTDPSLAAPQSALDSGPSAAPVLISGEVDLSSSTVRPGARLSEVHTATPHSIESELSASTITISDPVTPPEPLRAQRPTIPEPIRERANERASRPTMPIGPRVAKEALRGSVALEDLSTSVVDPLIADRARNSTIPLEDRPTPLAQAPLPHLFIAPDSRASAPALPPAPPLTPSTRRIPTGPQLPADMAALYGPEGLDDSPTEIASEMPDREDPTDTQAETREHHANPFDSGPHVMHGLVSTAFSSPPPPPAVYVRERNLATAVIARLKKVTIEPVSPRTWAILCGMFIVAVITACTVALI